MIKINKTDETLASEIFSPEISDEYSASYRRLLTNISNTLAINRDELIQEEIDHIEGQTNADDQIIESVDTLKYLAILHVLLDLSKQGWIFVVEDEVLTLRMESIDVDPKAMIRYRLSAERNAQFKIHSVQSFIEEMERIKTYKGEQISIQSLFGDKHILSENIINDALVCAPYVQLATNERDKYTGYRLSDIWRYFRYTWAIPYKTMPGRNLYYLVRDSLQPHHPVIGIFALGNTVLNLSVRDDDIGWTVEAINKQLSRKTSVTHCEQKVGETEGGTVKVKISRPLESEEEYIIRANAYADRMYPLLIDNLETAIKDIYVKDLHYYRQTKYPKLEYIEELTLLSEELRKQALNNHNNEINPDWEEEAKTILFKRKRASELAKLLTAKLVFQKAVGETNYEKLSFMLASEKGRQAINTALIANRKFKIGSNMMEIIVCGAIPPYNELLCGKLVSMLACSPVVVRDYTKKYEKQVSEIASRMKGRKVVRDSHLAFLGTTSLYSIGSSQYNRIKVPFHDGSTLEYRKMGITEGYGTVYFSTETTALFSKLLESVEGGKRINHVFGEGTSPRFRMISRGLSLIGIRADAFLKHYSPRIVYSMDLARNTKDFLLGLTDELDYGYDLDNEQQVEQRTQEMIDYWYNRWLKKRLTTVNILDRLEAFDEEALLLSNMF